ncbi:hypothetical protein NFA_40090 [Nocardia farcinica IFM 10152]|uniref:Uncharacterized protein n=1 Tax=Nocardia farcinica (strain IFM 10152) TaxID=247156 RepID=Q5YSI4_NOCFA|nr:hypothetical protein NFA_40090 [Nocardia farcinica IFM 10152]
MTSSPSDRPDLTAWRRRQALCSSNAAQPIPSGKQYERKLKHEREKEQRGWLLRGTGKRGSTVAVRCRWTTPSMRVMRWLMVAGSSSRACFMVPRRRSPC